MRYEQYKCIMERNINQCKHAQPLKSMKLLGMNTDGFCLKTNSRRVKRGQAPNIHTFNLGIEALKVSTFLIFWAKSYHEIFVNCFDDNYNIQITRVLNIYMYYLFTMLRRWFSGLERSHRKWKAGC